MRWWAGEPPDKLQKTSRPFRRAPEPCGNCDNCLNRRAQDATDAARKAVDDAGFAACSLGPTTRVVLVGDAVADVGPVEAQTKRRRGRLRTLGDLLASARVGGGSERRRSTPKRSAITCNCRPGQRSLPPLRCQ